MIKYGKIVNIIFTLFIVSNVLLSINVKGCKDIIAVGDATEGDYNLLLKVRDPSRPGLKFFASYPKDMNIPIIIHGLEKHYNLPYSINSSVSQQRKISFQIL